MLDIRGSEAKLVEWDDSNPRAFLLRVNHETNFTSEQYLKQCKYNWDDDKEKNRQKMVKKIVFPSSHKLVEDSFIQLLYNKNLVKLLRFILPRATNPILMTLLLAKSVKYKILRSSSETQLLKLCFESLAKLSCELVKDLWKLKKLSENEVEAFFRNSLDYNSQINVFDLMIENENFALVLSSHVIRYIDNLYDCNVIFNSFHIIHHFEVEWLEKNRNQKESKKAKRLVVWRFFDNHPLSIGRWHNFAKSLDGKAHWRRFVSRSVFRWGVFLSRKTYTQQKASILGSTPSRAIGMFAVPTATFYMHVFSYVGWAVIIIASLVYTKATGTVHVITDLGLPALEGTENVITVYDFFILFYGIGLLLHVFEDIAVNNFSRYFNSFYNLLNLIIILLSLGGFGLRHNGFWDYGHAIWAMIPTFYFFRGILFFEIVENLGPMVGVIEAMIFTSASFFIPLLIMSFGFIYSFNYLYAGIEGVPELNWFSHISKFIVYGFGGLDPVFIETPKNNNDSYHPAYIFAMICIIMFTLVVTLMFFNLLIAILSAVQERAVERLGGEYRLTRSELILRVFRQCKQSRLPPPWNLLQIIHPDRHLVGYFFYLIFLQSVVLIIYTVFFIFFIFFIIFPRTKKQKERKKKLGGSHNDSGLKELIYYNPISLLIYWAYQVISTIIALILAYGNLRCGETEIEIGTQVEPSGWWKARLTCRSFFTNLLENKYTRNLVLETYRDNQFNWKESILPNNRRIIYQIKRIRETDFWGFKYTTFDINDPCACEQSLTRYIDFRVLRNNKKKKKKIKINITRTLDQRFNFLDWDDHQEERRYVDEGVKILENWKTRIKGDSKVNFEATINKCIYNACSKLEDHES